MKLQFILLTLPLVAGTEFPAPYDSEAGIPMPASEAAAGFKVPPGFKVTLFAAEPELRNPVAMTWDARGRLWVVENFTYAERAKKFDLQLRDRVLVFEDGNGDGRFSSRKVFTDDVQVASSIEVGHGGVWLLCPPRLLFIPDGNGDAVPDGNPVIVLDGFTIPESNYHGFANGLRFGPDGWLYGRCGASAPGEVGAPGGDRIPMRGTLWRYHPKRKIFEALSSGTTNPWGHDWDEHGELFFINTVNGHLWHGITGAHYVRSHTIDPNPRAYALIDQHADHWHFDTSQDWTKSRDGAANDLGGGHAHVGMMIYQGDNWPAEYRGKLFTWNMHGRRLNQEILSRSGSGYVGRHGADVMLAEDKWFRGIDLSTGPDGAVFALDWSDTGECHDSTGVHRGSGRVFKFSYGEPKPAGVFDLTTLDAQDLVKLHTHANEWWVRQARLELAARNTKDAVNGLLEVCGGDGSIVHRLSALRTLHAMGALNEEFLTARLNDPDEHIRTWAIRLLSDAWPLDTALGLRPSGRAEPEIAEALLARFSQIAREDESGLVRLAIASMLQRLPVSHRPALAAPLLARVEDAKDHNLPLMLWYGLIPVADHDPAALVKLASVCELPMTRRFIARRLAEDIERNPTPLNALLIVTADKPEVFQSDILAGLSDGLAGWRKARKPSAWDLFVGKLAGSRNVVAARDLGVTFGDGRALDEVKRLVLDEHADLAKRKAALQTLIESGPPDLRELCERLLATGSLNTIAIRGLARYDDPAIGEKIAKSYANFSNSERPAIIDILVSRNAFARSLLARVAAGEIARADITPFHARQIRSLEDKSLTRQLTEVWGELRDSPAAKKELIARLRKQLTPEALATADPRQGRVLFSAVCAACHVLYGTGGTLGPDLTGAGRDNLDYLLDNIADPSAVVGADFRMTVVNLKDGRVLNGFISARTERTLTVRTMVESVTLERSEITGIQESALSIMPEGLLENLSEKQSRDLISYLMGKSQVALPE